MSWTKYENVRISGKRDHGSMKRSVADPETRVSLQMKAVRKVSARQMPQMKRAAAEIPSHSSKGV